MAQHSAKLGYNPQTRTHSRHSCTRHKPTQRRHINTACCTLHHCSSLQTIVLAPNALSCTHAVAAVQNRGNPVTQERCTDGGHIHASHSLFSHNTPTAWSAGVRPAHQAEHVAAQVCSSHSLTQIKHTSGQAGR